MRSALRASLSILAVVAGSTSPVRADDLWVDASSPACSDGRSRADNSADAPWCSLRPAERLPEAGDVVHVRPGTYRDDDGDGFVLVVRVSGAEGRPVVYRSTERWRARMVGDVSDTTHCVNTATSMRHVVLEGFEITGCHTAINVNNDNHYVTVRGNWIHDIGRRITSTTSGQSGISYGGGSTFLVVDGNLFHTIGRLPGSDHAENHDHGVYIRSTDVTIVNNVFYDMVAGWPIHIYSPSAWKERILIAFNTFAEPNPHRPGHILMYPMTRDVSIRDNLFLDPLAAPVRNVGCEGKTGISIAGNATTVDRWIDGDACSIAVRDNVASAPDLGFVDAAGRDFRLTPGSIAIDAATGIAPIPETDFAGTARPQGSAPDLGAFEHGGTMEPPPDAGAPTVDAGIDDAGPPPGDGGVAMSGDDGGMPRADGGVAPADPTTEPRSTTAHGGCAPAGAPRRSSWLAAVLLCLSMYVHRRRARRAP